jgi:hypothetical protein
VDVASGDGDKAARGYAVVIEDKYHLKLVKNAA